MHFHNVCFHNASFVRGTFNATLSAMIELLPELLPAEKSSSPEAIILVVEDDRDQQLALTLQLRSQGFEVVSAAEGSEALALAAERRPALVLLDIGLPDMNGWDLCRQMVDGLAGDLPVIALSGNDHHGALQRSRTSGCRYFIRKPYDPNALLVLIETALRDDQLW